MQRLIAAIVLCAGSALASAETCRVPAVARIPRVKTSRSRSNAAV